MMLSYIYTDEYDDSLQPDDFVGLDMDDEEFYMFVTAELEKSSHPRPTKRRRVEASPPPADEDNVTVQLHNNMHVYVLADKFNIAGLKELSISKFINVGQQSTGMAYIPIFADRVFDATSGHDEGLRTALLTLLAGYPHTVLEQLLFLVEVWEGDKLEHQLRDCIIKKYSDEVSSQKKTISSLKERITVLKGDRKRLRSRLSDHEH